MAVGKRVLNTMHIIRLLRYSDPTCLDFTLMWDEETKLIMAEVETVNACGNTEYLCDLWIPWDARPANAEMRKQVTDRINEIRHSKSADVVFTDCKEAKVTDVSVDTPDGCQFLFAVPAPGPLVEAIAA